MFVAEWKMVWDFNFSNKKATTLEILAVLSTEFKLPYCKCSLL